MIEMTTSSSISVNPAEDVRKKRGMDVLVERISPAHVSAFVR
jgi:hypothetical protein